MPDAEKTAAREAERFLIAGAQMPVPIGGNVGAMLSQVEKTMAIFTSVDLIVFSELAAHGPLHAGPLSIGPQAPLAFHPPKTIISPVLRAG